MSGRLASLRVGIVGTGFMGLAHTEALRRLGVQVVGIVGSTPERARAKAESANLPDVYGSLDALLDEAAVDAVHVTSPNHLHFAQVRSVLTAQKHVICEKPLALNSVETAELVTLAEAGGLVNATCFNQRFYPMVQQARTMVAGGDLGEVRLVSGGYLQDWLLLDTDWNWRLESEKAGHLRAVADIGSHWFDNIGFITGERITEVFADLHTFVSTRRRPVGEVETFGGHAMGDAARVEQVIASDDAAGLLLRFENGGRGVGTLSQVSAGRKNAMSWEINGGSSSISWNQEAPDDLWIGHRGRANEILKRDPSLLHPLAAATAAYPAGHVEGYPDTFRAMFASIYADIVVGRPAAEPSYPTFKDGHEAVLVCEAVATSASTRQWATVGS